MISLIHPTVLEPHPSVVMSMTGGLVATVLLSGLLMGAPLLGLPLIEYPLLIGGIFTFNSTVALWLGFWFFLLVGIFGIPAGLSLVWPLLPGRDVGIPGSFLKGVVYGFGLWILNGVALPIAGVLNRIGETPRPGPFAIRFGFLGAGELLLWSLVYGVALALITGMSHGMKPLDLLGWMGYRVADLRDVAVNPARQAGKQFGVPSARVNE